jgi:RNase P/RNase MRP subunit POP5
MRLKHSYFICELDFGTAASRVCAASDIFAALKRVYTECFGDAGWGRAAGALAVKHVDCASRLCIIRGFSASRTELHACIALVKSVQGQPIALRVNSIASTVRSLRSRFASIYRSVTGNTLEGASSTIEGDAPRFWASLEEDA